MKIIKQIILICLLLGLLFGQGSTRTKGYLAVGFLDHKTGTSLVGLAKTLWQKDHHEIFIGGGTLIAAFTASLGWKYYFSNTPVRPYVVLAIHGISGMGGSFKAPFISVGLEKNIWKKLYINGGFNSTIRPHSEAGLDFVNLPTINLNYRY
ncbi:MAG: hypothetical protein ISR83_00165 [Candidatus Marinimicrobia bacterium]|nr:hypothetical protein [Candidatus Neomarinimicrobiota bacterium]